MLGSATPPAVASRAVVARELSKDGGERAIALGGHSRRAARWHRGRYGRSARTRDVGSRGDARLRGGCRGLPRAGHRYREAPRGVPLDGGRGLAQPGWSAAAGAGRRVRQRRRLFVVHPEPAGPGGEGGGVRGPRRVVSLPVVPPRARRRVAANGASRVCPRAAAANAPLVHGGRGRGVWRGPDGRRRPGLPRWRPSRAERAPPARKLPAARRAPGSQARALRCGRSGLLRPVVGPRALPAPRQRDARPAGRPVPGAGCRGHAGGEGLRGKLRPSRGRGTGAAAIHRA
ncbi:MAG: hypothetical protein BWZ09_02687 [Alphaproteobacteria bacterium ADurb.BinA305]|nr:MAG: hypothetical protein BWZ09_02687 [Alphaproteobacteria bacterium ADurb.BinA305]